MTTQAESGENWEALADQGDEEMRRELRSRDEALASLSEDERRARLGTMIRAEFALPEEKLLRVTEQRLRTWLEMELEAAQKIAQSYDRVMNTMPGEVAFHRVQVVQTVAIHFHDDDLDRLGVLIPAVIRQIPHLARIASAQAATAEAAAYAAARRSWWAFWRRS